MRSPFGRAPAACLIRTLPVRVELPFLSRRRVRGVLFPAARRGIRIRRSCRDAVGMDSAGLPAMSAATPTGASAKSASKGPVCHRACQTQDVGFSTLRWISRPSARALPSRPTSNVRCPRPDGLGRPRRRSTAAARRLRVESDDGSDDDVGSRRSKPTVCPRPERAEMFTKGDFLDSVNLVKSQYVGFREESTTT